MNQHQVDNQWISPDPTQKQRELVEFLCVEREQRVRDLLGQYQVGGIPQQATERERGDGLARVLRRLLPAQVIAERLIALGFDPARVLEGELRSLSLTRGFVDVASQRWGGEYRTGSRMSEKICEQFPELLPLIVRNAVFSAPPGSSWVQLAVQNPNITGFTPCYWDLSGVSSGWSITQVLANYRITNVPTSQRTVDLHTVVDPYGSNGGGTIPPSFNSDLGTNWNAAGIAWVSANAGTANASPGNVTLSFTLTPGLGTAWMVVLDERSMTIFY